MGYRKIKADKIFNGYGFLEDQVLITDRDGKIEDLISVSDAGNDLEIYKGMLVPGLVNCHCHMELSHMKGIIPERTGLVDFVYKVVTERHHSNDEIFQAIANAEGEMFENGIVAVGDICNNALTIPQKQKGSLAYYNFIEASGWLPSVARERFVRALDLYREYSMLNIQCSMFNSIVPHASYSVSENLWEEIQPYFENRTVTIHNQETAFEDEFFLEGTGDFQRMYQLMKIDNSHHQPSKQTSLQSYFDKLAKAGNIILVHNTFTSQADIEYVKRETSNVRHNIHQNQRTNVKSETSKVRHQRPTTNYQPAWPAGRPQTFFCLCVNANQYIENSLPPIELLRKNNCMMVLGTDSLASNWSLNILDEIKTIRKNFPEIPMEELLQWATINGARALEMDNVLGSFEKGRKPGIILVDEVDLYVKKLA